MANEHIGRKQSIGVGKEATSGTSVSAARWIPKISGEFTPTNFTADDIGAYGVIDELRDQQLVKTITTVDFSCDFRDVYGGDLLMGLFGTEYSCIRFPIPGSITGTFTVGETVTETTTVAKGTLRRADVGGTSKVLFIDSPAVGTFTVTIASPAVFSLTAHGFVAGDGVSFTTTGALPTGIVANTNYFVIAAGLTANAFEISATSGGAAINATGSQSGTHTAYRGYFAGGNTLTGATSTATATGGTIEAPSAVRTHVYTLLNNNTHPSYTIYGSDPVGDFKSVYCMLDSLDMEIASGGFAVAKAKFMGKKIQSASTQTPSYTAQNAFLAKYATFYDASAYTGLDAAAATVIKSMKLNWKKNLVDFQGWGATDVTGFYNRQYSLSGELVLLYNATTFQTYTTTSNQTRAFRIKLSNTDQTIGSSSNPTLQIDIPQVTFKDWKRSSGNNDLVEQTISFKAVYDITTSQTCGCLLTNTSTAQY